MLIVGPGVADGTAREADGAAEGEAEADDADGTAETDADTFGDPQPIATTALTISAAQVLSSGTWRWRWR